MNKLLLILVPMVPIYMGASNFAFYGDELYSIKIFIFIFLFLLFFMYLFRYISNNKLRKKSDILFIISLIILSYLWFQYFGYNINLI